MKEDGLWDGGVRGHGRYPTLAAPGWGTRIEKLSGAAVALDQVVGGAVVMQVGVRLALQFGNDPLRQRLAQFHAPLVEGVDLPDGALGEDAVLVKRDEPAEGLGRQPVDKDHVRWAVALEDTMGDEPVGGAFVFDLLGSLAEGQRFGLGEHIGHQYVMVPAEVVERLREGDEVAGNQVRALVDQLVERVLSVGAWLAPVDGSGGVIDGRAIERDGFSVALHGELLQIGGEA